MALPYVYKLTHPVSGEFYFGYRWKNVDDAKDDLGKKYFTSSKYVKPRFREFSVEILAEFRHHEDAYWFEQGLIKENFKNPLILNRRYQPYKNGSIKFGWSENSNSVAAREKISAKLKGREKSSEHKQKVADANRGSKRSDEAKKNMRVSKTITEKVLAAHERLKNSDSLAKPRKCSCVMCREVTTSNQISRHKCKRK